MPLKESSIKNNLIQFITYALIGGSNVIINFIVLNTLSSITKIYSATNTYTKLILFSFEVIAFILYSINGYLLNRKFTFKYTKSSYPKYALVLGISSFFNANLFILLTAHNTFNFNAKLWFNISKLISSITIGVITFLVNKFFIFKENANL